MFYGQGMPKRFIQFIAEGYILQPDIIGFFHEDLRILIKRIGVKDLPDK